MIATRIRVSICLVLFALLVSGQVWSQKAEVLRKQGGVPRTFLLEGKQLQINRQRIQNGDKSLAQALAKLESEAQKALTIVPFSVVHKQQTPPSGDKHDYMSQAPYFWADPKTADGLPYIRRDGERNPEINKISDRQNIGRLISTVETLALAYYLKGDEAYAAKAAQLLRTWYLDPATRMKPNLQYAQAIPGINTGRGIGLIETSGLTQVVDAVGLLAGSKAWTKADQRGLQDWFARFLQWMLGSKNGRDEAAAKNNHGTYYDMQIASFALFVGKRELARGILQGARQKRVATQIEPDGRQPLELARTRSWSYSVMNLRGLIQLAVLGEHLGVDLWNYETADGRGIRKALDYLLPFALGGQKWPYQQLGEWPAQELFPLLRKAAAKYQNQQYQALLLKIPNPGDTDRGHLLVAKLAQSQPSSK